MKLSTLIGVSAAINGAVAITGNSSGIHIYGNDSLVPDAAHIPNRGHDQVYAAAGGGAVCNLTVYSTEALLLPGDCFEPLHGFGTVRTRILPGQKISIFADARCVLATFTDSNCTKDGAIIQRISDPDDEDVIPSSRSCLTTYTVDGGERVPAQSLKYACDDAIDEGWVDPWAEGGDDRMVSARSVDTEHSRDHVTVIPADGLNCNSAQHRDTDTKVHGHCHSFDKPFSSLSATIKRAGHSKVGGSEPCSVLVFSDMDCKKDGAEVIDLNDTGALGVCHNVALHHGNDLGTAIAGHSWKWVCGRQDIGDCIGGSGTDTDIETTAVKKGKTLTVTATTSLACSLTTEAAHSLDVITSVVTQKPVTHTITSVFTKTQLRVRTKLITSVATAVSTVRHTVTKPFSTTYKVCDVEASAQS